MKNLLIVGIAGGVGRSTVHDLFAGGYTRIVGVDVAPGAAEKLPQTHPIPLYRSISEAFAHEAIGGVYICSPDFNHRDAALEALRFDVPVLCEKPMGISREQAGDMLKASQRSKGWLQLGFEYRFSRIFARAKEIIASGELGGARNITCEYCSGPYGPDAMWRLTPEKNIGIFSEKLCHMIDLFRFWMDDEISKVHAFRGVNVTPHYPPELPDNVIGIYHFRSGGMALLIHNHVVASEPIGLVGQCGPLQHDPNAQLLAFREAGHQQRSCIICERGTLIVDVWAKQIVVSERIDNGNLGEKRIEDLQGASFTELSHDMRGEVLDFIERMDRGLPARLDIADSHRSSIATLASEESLKTGAAVQLS